MTHETHKTQASNTVKPSGRLDVGCTVTGSGVATTGDFGGPSVSFVPVVTILGSAGAGAGVGAGAGAGTVIIGAFGVFDGSLDFEGTGMTGIVLLL